jgi:uncharacterized protein YaeQ
MALKSTNYKANLQIADIDRGLYADHALTFGRGLSDTDEPDLWRHGLDGRLRDRIEVGQPDDRLVRACGRADRMVELQPTRLSPA